MPFGCFSGTGVFGFPGPFGRNISAPWTLLYAGGGVCIVTGSEVVNHGGCLLGVVGGGELGDFPQRLEQNSLDEFGG